MPSTSRQIISTAQLAKYLGISQVAVFKRIKSGRIKATKIGRSYALDRAYMEAYFPGLSPRYIEEGSYVSVMEAAKMLGITRMAVFNRIKAGKIPAKKVGSRYVIAKEHILKETTQPKEIPEITKEYLSIPELAQIMGISRIHVFRKVKKGIIKARRVGRHYVIAREDVFVPEGIGEIRKKDEKRKMERHISLMEAAKILGISRVAVYKKVKKGQLSAKRIGRSYAVLREDLGGE